MQNLIYWTVLVRSYLQYGMQKNKYNNQLSSLLLTSEWGVPSSPINLIINHYKVYYRVNALNLCSQDILLRSFIKFSWMHISCLQWDWFQWVASLGPTNNTQPLLIYYSPAWKFSPALSPHKFLIHMISPSPIHAL